jgi:hypothetical protein
MNSRVRRKFRVVVASLAFLFFNLAFTNLCFAKTSKPKYKLCPYNKLAFRFYPDADNKVSSSFKFNPECIWVRKEGNHLFVILSEKSGKNLELQWRPTVPDMLIDSNRKYSTQIGAPAQASISGPLRRSLKGPTTISQSEDSWIRIKELPVKEGDYASLDFDLLLEPVDLKKPVHEVSKPSGWVRGTIRAPLIQLVGKPMKIHFESSTHIEDDFTMKKKRDEVVQLKNISDKQSIPIHFGDADCSKKYFDDAFDCIRFYDDGNSDFGVYLYSAAAARRGVQQVLRVGWRGAKNIEATKILNINSNEQGLFFEYQWNGIYVFKNQLEGNVSLTHPKAGHVAVELTLKPKNSASEIRALRGTLTTTDAKPISRKSD